MDGPSHVRNTTLKKMPENNKDTTKVSSITVEDMELPLKEPLLKEDADRLAKEIKEARESKGEWSIPKEVLERLNGLVFNPGKPPVTETDKEIGDLKRQNELLKSRLDDMGEVLKSLKEQKSQEPDSSEPAEPNKEPEPKKDAEPSKDPEPKKDEGQDDDSGTEPKKQSDQDDDDSDGKSDE